MPNDISLNSLTEFGFTNYEARIYLSLLEKKQLTATEIARLSNIPRTRVYDDLKSLESKGLCQVVSGKTKLYSAADPSQMKDVLNRISEEKINQKQALIEEKINQKRAKNELDIQKEKERLELELKKEKDRLVNKLRDADDLVEKLFPIYEQSRENDQDIDYIEVIKDSTQIQARVCECMADAKNEILVFSKPPYLSKKEMAEQDDIGLTAMAKGTAVKIIFQIPHNKEESKMLLNDIKYYQSRGEQVRVTEKLPLKLIIFDEEVVIYSLEDNLTFTMSSTASVFRHRSMAELTKKFFEMVWEKAEGIEALEKMV